MQKSTQQSWIPQAREVFRAAPSFPVFVHLDLCSGVDGDTLVTQVEEVWGTPKDLTCGTGYGSIRVMSSNVVLSSFRSSLTEREARPSCGCSEASQSLAVLCLPYRRSRRVTPMQRCVAVVTAFCCDR